jgi:DNA-binding MurR/RpiR family transcriptional regulator
MKDRRAKYNSEEFARRWHSDETLASMAAWLGVSVPAVYRAAMRRGLPKRLEMRASRMKESRAGQ